MPSFLEMQLIFFRTPRTNLTTLEVGNRQCVPVLCADINYKSKLFEKNWHVVYFSGNLSFASDFSSPLRKKLFLVRNNKILNMGGKE